MNEKEKLIKQYRSRLQGYTISELRRIVTLAEQVIEQEQIRVEVAKGLIDGLENPYLPDFKAKQFTD